MVPRDGTQVRGSRPRRGGLEGRSFDSLGAGGCGGIYGVPTRTKTSPCGSARLTRRRGDVQGRAASRWPPHVASNSRPNRGEIQHTSPDAGRERDGGTGKDRLHLTFVRSSRTSCQQRMAAVSASTLDGTVLRGDGRTRARSRGPSCRRFTQPALPVDRRLSHCMRHGHRLASGTLSQLYGHNVTTP